MDTVIGNKYVDIFNNLDIEVSKKLEGEYTVEEIISTYSNFFFNKMFLDITSIKNYKNLTNLQRLSMGINMDKVILLLDKDDVISDSEQFLSRLVSMGIYNFTKDSNNLMYLYSNPNSYRDVAYLQDVKNDNSNVIVNENVSRDSSNGNDKIILGIKNVTYSSGSTTLVYLLKKILSDYYSTLAIEVDKNEFIYFKDKDMISVKDKDFDATIKKYKDVDFFIVDLDDNNKEHLCTDVLYLIEPSTIKLNKLMLVNPNIFSELSGKKVILNQCLLNDNDISNFEVESGLNTYYSIGPLNDKEDCSCVLLPLLEKLGYVKVLHEEKKEVSNVSSKKSIFDIFKSK